MSLIIVNVMEPLTWMMSWVPFFTLTKVIFMGLVLLEGKFAVGIGRRFEGSLSDMVKKWGWVGDYLEAGSVLLKLKLCIWTMRWVQPVLKRAPEQAAKDLEALCHVYLSSLAKTKPRSLSPSPSILVDDFTDSSQSPTIPPSPLNDSLASTSVISYRKLEQSFSSSFQSSKPPPVPVRHIRNVTEGKSRLEQPKESIWKVSVQLLVKKASKTEAAQYSPHCIWFEPGKKTLLWQAIGEEIIHSDHVLSAKIPPKSTLLLQIECAEGVKWARFTDPERFSSWSQRLLKALGRS